MLFFWIFHSSSSSDKVIAIFTQIFVSTSVFSIDNNQKYLLSIKSAYYNDFWRSCDTEDWSNDAENTALITAIKYFEIK